MGGVGRPASPSQRVVRSRARASAALTRSVRGYADCLDGVWVHRGERRRKRRQSCMATSKLATLTNARRYHRIRQWPRRERRSSATHPPRLDDPSRPGSDEVPLTTLKTTFAARRIGHSATQTPIDRSPRWPSVTMSIALRPLRLWAPECRPIQLHASPPL